MKGLTVHERFRLLLRAKRIPVPVPEYRFDTTRRWRFDYAWPERRFALEVEGGVWTRGRHTRGKGYLADMEKYNSAAVQGWTVIRVTPADLCTDNTIAMLESIFR